jgi:hypothetical protein
MAPDWDSRDEWEDEDEAEQPHPAGLGGMLERFKNAPWVKEHPNLIKGIAVGVLLLLMLLLLGQQLNWFGEAERAPAVAERPGQEGQPPPPAQPTPPAGKAATGKSKESSPAAEKNPHKPGEKENVKHEEPRPLPDDVAQWKKEDYFRARRESNPKLVEAVARLGERTRGSVPAAQGLTDLLKPLPPEPPPTSGPTLPAPGAPAPASGAPSPPVAPPAPGAPWPPVAPPARGSSPPAPAPPAPAAVTAAAPRPRDPALLQKLVETIITALGENGTELARKTLEQILSGVLATDNDKAAVEAALRELLAHPGPENDALLVRVIAAPEALRPADRQGPWPAKDLRARALELTKATGSRELRTRLAEALADRLGRLSVDDPVREFLLAADPLNCGAQMVLFERGVFAKEINVRLQQQLTSFAALALARLLRLPTQAQPGLAASPGVAPPRNASNPAEADPGLRLAGLLWTETFGASLISKLAETHSLEKQADLVLLAATIPRDPIRGAMAKTLRKHWNEGPKPLETVEASNKMVMDPGLLVLLKMFPRRSETKAGARAPVSRVRAVRGPPNGSAASTAKLTAEKKEQAEKEWMAFSSKLVAAWCARFQAAAQARDKAEAEAGSPSTTAVSKLPSEFEMANGAKVVTAYHLVWPAEVPAELANAKPSPLEIYYLRVEETNKPKKAIGYYARQLQVKTSEIRKTENDKADWLDSVRVLQQTNRRRSVDVLLTRADNKPRNAASDNEETDLIVEILTIEIKDPAGRE